MLHIGDNDKGYSKENCRWATHEEQANNKRNNVLIEIDGESKTYSEWAEISGINKEEIARRIYRGWDSHRAVFQKKRKQKQT